MHKKDIYLHMSEIRWNSHPAARHLQRFPRTLHGLFLVPFPKPERFWREWYGPFRLGSLFPRLKELHIRFPLESTNISVAHCGDTHRHFTAETPRLFRKIQVEWLEFFFAKKFEKGKYFSLSHSKTIFKWNYKIIHIVFPHLLAGFFHPTCRVFSWKDPHPNPLSHSQKKNDRPKTQRVLKGRRPQMTSSL